jgi:glycosyltransferase involved in cell wall biosynthesis
MEQYVAEMLDSILMQKTTFPFEIIISDDGSQDRTCEIVNSYQLKYDNIRLINTGHIGKMPNFIGSL